MISATLDTNVLAPGFVRRDSVPGELVAAWLAGIFRLVVSAHVLGELEQTLRNAYFRTLMSADRAAANVQLLHDSAQLVDITAQVHGVATHPEDDLVLATAVSGGVDYLVTGDRQLLRLGSYEGVAIVAPRTFLDVLGLGGGEG